VICEWIEWKDPNTEYAPK